jgi:hypothetical protein
MTARIASFKSHAEETTMTKPNSEIRELGMDEMDRVSGGSVEIKELVIRRW